MDEFDIKVLEANGYTVEYGAILSPEGNYVSTIDLNGKNYKSEINYDLWYKAKKQEEKFANKTSDPILDNMMLISNEKTIEVLNSDAKETLKTTKTLMVKSDVKSPFRTEYKYPIVLGVSIVIYLIIKRLVK